MSLILAASLLPLAGFARLNVVTTTRTLGSIAEEVGGERVDVTALVRAGEDPHFVRPRPSFIPVLNRADLLVAVGAELEAGWLPPLVRAARNRDILVGGRGHVAMAGHVELIGVPSGPVNRGMGDVHASGNPHFMHDPRNGRIAAEVLAQRFSDLDPEGAETYARNLELFRGQLDERLTVWQRELASLEGLRVVAYHKSYDYFARAFGFRIVGQIEPLPGIEPSPRHVLDLIAAMREENVGMIWMEPFRPRRTADRIAEETGARLVLLPEQVGAVKGAAGYLAWIDYNVRQVVEAAAREEK